MIPAATGYTASGIRPATLDDAGQLAGMLARSFESCPAWGSFLPPEARRRPERMERFFGSLLTRLYLRPGRECTTNDARTGAALWDPPGGWKLSPGENLRLLAAMAPVFRRHIPHAARCFGAIDAGHPAEPHWYLSVLGVEPAARKSGVAAALLLSGLERCDREHTPAYTETGRPRSRDFYAAHGFEVIEEFELPGGGPAVWRMWREPRLEG